VHWLRIDGVSDKSALFFTDKISKLRLAALTQYFHSHHLLTTHSDCNGRFCRPRIFRLLTPWSWRYAGRSVIQTARSTHNHCFSSWHCQHQQSRWEKHLVIGSLQWCACHRYRF